MPIALNVAGEVATSAVALAGLVLVFLGAVASSYHSYIETPPPAVRARYRFRAWLAFLGFALSLGAASLALFAKAFGNEPAALAAVLLLLAALGLVLASAVIAVLQIR